MTSKLSIQFRFYRLYRFFRCFYYFAYWKAIATMFSKVVMTKNTLELSTTHCKRNSKIKFHNSFPIAGVDITRHANSPTHAKRTFFRTERPLNAKLYKTSKKITVTWRIMTAGPLENKRGEPSLVEKKYIKSKNKCAYEYVRSRSARPTTRAARPR